MQCDVHVRGARVACARRNVIANDGGMAAAAARAALATRRDVLDQVPRDATNPPASLQSVPCPQHEGLSQSGAGLGAGRGFHPDHRTNLPGSPGRFSPRVARLTPARGARARAPYSGLALSTLVWGSALVCFWAGATVVVKLIWLHGALCPVVRGWRGWLEVRG